MNFIEYYKRNIKVSNFIIKEIKSNILRHIKLLNKNRIKLLIYNFRHY